jgi:hypothetical protein
LTLVVLASLLPRLYFVATNGFSYDETHNLMFASLAAAGHAPYREVFTGIAPFALASIEASVWLLDSTPWVRLVMLIYGMAGIVGLFALVRRQATARPLLAATVAALLFSFNPHYFAVSTTLNLEAAAVAFGVLAVLAMAEYTRRPAAWRLLFSGLLFGLSLAIKVLVPFLPAVILVQMLQHGRDQTPARRLRSLVRMGLVWSAGMLAVAAFFALRHDPRLVYQQVVDFRLALRDIQGVNLTEELGWIDLAQFLPLLAGAAWGAVELHRRRSPARWVWLVWGGLSVLFLFLHTPLRPRHLVTLLPPLAALSGVAVAAGLAAPRPSRTARRVTAAAAGLTLAGLVMLALQAAPAEDFIARHPARAAVIRYLDATTAPGDCVVSKENRLLFLAGRFPPPYLSEVSTARLASGLLTGPAISVEVERHGCAAVVYADTFDGLAPELRGDLSRLYSLELTITDPQDSDPIPVFAVPLHTPAGPTVPQPVMLGDAVQFLGHDLSGTFWRAGGRVYLSTYWTARAAPPTDYKLFVHLVDSQGQRVLGLDHYLFTLPAGAQVEGIRLNPAYLAGGAALPADYPATGLIPTHLWLPGNVLKETVAFAVDLPTGGYTLRLGMVDAAGARLAVDDTVPGGVEDAIDLARVEVVTAEVAGP